MSRKTTESPRASKQGSCTPIPKAREPRSVEGRSKPNHQPAAKKNQMAEELAYKRKARLRGKHRKVRIQQVFDMRNLEEADRQARKGKRDHKGVRLFDRSKGENLMNLHKMLVSETYHTSPGHECVRHCPCGKDRLLHKLPYYPDHIAHHALMQVIMPVLMTYYYYESAASIKGKGMHFAARRVERWIDENRDAGRLYYAKLDFVKFYHLIDQQKIYNFLCTIFGNKGIRYLLWEVVTACEYGLGIGLFPIQPIANGYNCPLCRQLMAKFRVRVEIYCDDILIMSRDKKEVWKAVNYVKDYARDVMAQPLHENIGVQIIDTTHRVDFVGYQFFFGHTLLRKRMKGRFKRTMHRQQDDMHRYQSAQSYKGWLMHCDGFNLWKKVMAIKSFKELQVPSFDKKDADGKRMLEGLRVSMESLADHEIIFLDVEFDVRSKFPDKKDGTPKMSAVVQVEEYSKKKKFFTNNGMLIETLRFCKEKEMFPFKGTLQAKNKAGLPDYEIV